VSLFGIFGAAFGAPSAIRNTISLVQQLTNHDTIKSLVVNNPVVSSEIQLAQSTFASLETDVDNLKAAGFFSLAFFADAEKLAVDSAQGISKILAVFQDPNIENEILDDPALKSLVAQLYSTLKTDVGLLSELGVHIPIPVMVTAAASSVGRAATPNQQAVPQSAQPTLLPGQAPFAGTFSTTIVNLAPPTFSSVTPAPDPTPSDVVSGDDLDAPKSGGDVLERD
jgi:hypothetical protein